MTEFEIEMKAMAERCIEMSRQDDMHSCDEPESDCAGCDMMRQALDVLSQIGCDVYAG